MDNCCGQRGRNGVRMEVLGIQNGTLTVKERGRVGGHTVDLISVGTLQINGNLFYQ